MNLLRELRKFKKKSVLVKLRILILLAVMLIASTYTWFFVRKDDRINGFKGIVTEWDIEYSIDGEEITEEEVVIAIDEFYPEMEEFTKNIKTKNLKSSGAEVKYEITSVRLFGEEILEQLTDNNIATAGTTTNIFSTNEYPFNVGYYYDKTVLSGIKPDTPENAPETYSTLSIFANWDGVDNVKDTYFGQKTYEYYESNALAETYSPLEVTIKITAGRVGALD